MWRQSILIALLGVVLINASNVSAQVYIAGELHGVLPDTTYIVVSHIEVPEGASLLIRPGAVFLFQTGCYFGIYGYLHAAGTEQDSIKFMLNSGATSWYGIHFLSSAADSCKLEYCYITGSTDSGVRVDSDDALISHCTITGNTADYEGGGIRCYNADGTVISHCVISDNEVPSEGGGIQSYSCDTYMDNCLITGNTAGWAGGGINYLDSYGGSVTNCLIYGNHAEYYGGGINSFGVEGQIISNCTISSNTAVQNSGAIHGVGLSFVNCIIWGNDPVLNQGGLQVNYTDIQGGWTGVGNIDADPLFVMPDQHDYRLQWDSPCIDSGDPDSYYNDPDGTRADMGAFYYDQSIPVRILLTPHDAPILIPPAGGNFEYTIQATNNDSVSHSVEVWCDVTLPDGQIFGPVLGPLSVPIGSEETISRIRTQAVPGGAPEGLYFYNAYAVVDADTSSDSFFFYKQESNRDNVGGEWFNWGDEFNAERDPQSSISIGSLPSNFGYLTCHPNPFNPVTILCIQLPQACPVGLKVYDLSGREVVTLIDEWRRAGFHEVTFDGSSLASGIYLVYLTANDFNLSQKLVMIK